MKQRRQKIQFKTIKTKWYKQTQLYISAIHAMKHSKTLPEFYYCLTYIPVCVFVTNTNTTKKDYLTKVSYACWLSIFYRILIVFIRWNLSSPMFVCLFLSVVWWNFCCFRGWKKSHRKGVTSKRVVTWCIHFCGGWLLLVEMSEWECSLRKSHWRECVAL